MLIISAVNCYLNENDIIFYIAVLIVFVISFLFWFSSFWGASDSKWLVMGLMWLPLNAWADWCFLFATILIVQIFLTAAIRSLQKHFRFNDYCPKTDLALLIPINTASIIFILFYR